MQLIYRDKNAAFKYFNNLANRSSTKFHSQLGLMRLAIENNDHDEALIRARAANLYNLEIQN